MLSPIRKRMDRKTGKQIKYCITSEHSTISQGSIKYILKKTASPTENIYLTITYKILISIIITQSTKTRPLICVLFSRWSMCLCLIAIRQRSFRLTVASLIALSLYQPSNTRQVIEERVHIKPKPFKGKRFPDPGGIAWSFVKHHLPWSPHTSSFDSHLLEMQDQLRQRHEIRR